MLIDYFQMMTQNDILAVLSLLEKIKALASDIFPFIKLHLSESLSLVPSELA